MLLDGAAEMTFGEAEIGGAEIFLAEAEIVVGVLAEQPLGTASSGGGSPEPGGTVPVAAGSPSPAGAGNVDCVVSDFWNRSPSLVDVSQPLSHNRHAAVARRIRPALAPISVLSGVQVGFSLPGRLHATRR